MAGAEYAQLINATKHGFISETEIDVAVRRLMRRRMQSGDLDARGADGRSQTPYAQIPTSKIDTPEHQVWTTCTHSSSQATLKFSKITLKFSKALAQAVAHQIVRESVVMLTNGHVGGTAAAPHQPVLPLDAGNLRRVLVVGPTSNDVAVQAHTYHGAAAVASFLAAVVTETYLRGVCSSQKY